MKQTAVEWLVEELSDVLGPMDTNSIRDLLLMDAINRAKEMEKEQIENAYDKGQESEWHKSMGLMGDHYYNETFNTK